MSNNHLELIQRLNRNLRIDQDVKRALAFHVKNGSPNIVVASADQTVAGTTLTASTYLLLNQDVYNGGKALTGGDKYIFGGKLLLTSTASNGVKYDLSQGNATATAINWTSKIISASAIACASATALNTSVSSTNTALIAEFEGYIDVSAGGSFGIKFSEASNSTGVTLLKGSYIWTQRVFP